jgi:hypothetical protein
MAAIGACRLAIIKKLLPRKQDARPDYVTFAELQQGIVALGDKIDAHFLLSAKIESLTPRSMRSPKSISHCPPDEEKSPKHGIHPTPNHESNTTNDPRPQISRSTATLFHSYQF